MQIRAIEQTDLAKLVAIETASQVSPWSDAAFQRCWESRFPGWVIELENEIMGFILISIAAGECHILNLSIYPSHQRKGFGRQLLVAAMNWAKTKGATIVYLEVRRSNHGAIGLYRNMNFKLIGERKSYYQTPTGSEDALVFARDLEVIS